MTEKSCVECSLIKEMPVDFDIDDHDMTGYNARCKECLGTLPIKKSPKPKRVSKKRSKPSKRVTTNEKPVKVSNIAPDEVEGVPVSVVVPEDGQEDDD